MIDTIHLIDPDQQLSPNIFTQEVQDKLITPHQEDYIPKVEAKSYHAGVININGATFSHRNKGAWLHVRVSLSKLLLRNNFQSFDWQQVEEAIIQLNALLKQPLGTRTTIQRLDVSANFSVYPYHASPFIKGIIGHENRQLNSLTCENSRYFMNNKHTVLLYSKYEEVLKHTSKDEREDLLKDHPELTPHLLRLERRVKKQVKHPTRLAPNQKSDRLYLYDLLDPAVQQALTHDWYNDFKKVIFPTTNPDAFNAYTILQDLPGLPELKDRLLAILLSKHPTERELLLGVLRAQPLASKEEKRRRLTIDKYIRDLDTKAQALSPGQLNPFHSLYHQQLDETYAKHLASIHPLSQAA